MGGVRCKLTNASSNAEAYTLWTCRTNEFANEKIKRTFCLSTTIEQQACFRYLIRQVEGEYKEECTEKEGKNYLLHIWFRVRQILSMEPFRLSLCCYPGFSSGGGLSLVGNMLGSLVSSLTGGIFSGVQHNATCF